MAERKVHYFRIEGTLVEVNKEIYDTYYGIERHAKTLDEKDERNGKVSYNAMDTDEMLGEDMIPDLNSPSVEDIVVTRMMREKLRECLSLLSAFEQELVNALFFECMSEREFSYKSGVPQRTVNYRKRRTLCKLKKLLKK